MEDGGCYWNAFSAGTKHLAEFVQNQPFPASKRAAERHTVEPPFRPVDDVAAGSTQSVRQHVYRQSVCCATTYADAHSRSFQHNVRSIRLRGCTGGPFYFYSLNIFVCRSHFWLRRAPGTRLSMIVEGGLYRSTADHLGCIECNAWCFLPRI